MDKNRGNKKRIKYKGKRFLDINQNGQKHKNQIQTWRKNNEMTIRELDIEEVKQ